MADESNALDTASPPYTSFQSVKTLLGSLKEQGVPSRIDRSVLTNFSGSVGKQIVTALRFLKLVNGESRSTPALTNLVAAYDTPNWKTQLEDVLHNAYSNFFASALDLQNCTPKEFAEVFKDTYPGAEAVVSKSRTFFLNAVREAEIPITSRLTAASKPRTAPARRKAPKAEGKPKVKTPENLHQSPPPPAGAVFQKKKPSEVLFEEFNPTAMPEDIQQAVWTLIKFFKQHDK